MPRKNSSPPPPEPMTWGKASPKLALAVVFDALGLMCGMVWLFGPALAGVICTVVGSNYAPAAISGALCTIAAGGAGVAAATVLVPLGTVLGMAVGLLGWLTIGLWLVMTNKDIFKANALWFASSLLFEEIPLIGALPMLTGILIKMYATQIRTEKEAYKKFHEEQAALLIEERRREEAALLAQRLTQEQAANDAEYAQATNDENYDQEEIPENEQRAA